MTLINEQSRPRLEAWLAGQAGARRVTIGEVTLLSGGSIQQNLAMTLTVDGGRFDGRHAVVLRTSPPTAIADTRSKSQEFAILRAAFQAGVKAPEPLFSCGDRAVLGCDFYVMRRAAGAGAGFRMVKNEAPQRELARELGRQIARLHTVRPGTVEGLDSLPLPEPTPALAAVRDCRTWLQGEDERDPVLAWGLRWLERNAPPTEELVLCHRDYRTGNYLVEDGRLTAILDWEFAGWSDPMEDLGWFCARSWRFGRFDREAGGIADRDDLYAGYEEVSGKPVDRARVDYWEAVAEVRWGTIVLMQGGRHTSGVEPSLELALTGRMLPAIELDLLLHLDAVERRRA
ncbi:MAG TPA: phosphotransferase family protein [Azospirillum sp.]|nr:phosphotransferase family protein [Azospirillum sp.]